MSYFEKIKSLPIKKEAIILGIETSCDETAVAVIKNGREILSDVIISSAMEHVKFGGVVPEIASRAHTTAILTATKRALEEAKITKDEIDAIAVTYGAGLLGALLVGVSFAKSLAYAWGKPLIPVSHIRGHISASYLADKSLEPPFITILGRGTTFSPSLASASTLGPPGYFKPKTLATLSKDSPTASSIVEPKTLIL